MSNFTEPKLPEEISEVLETVWTLDEQGQATVENVIRETHTRNLPETLLRRLEGERLVSLEEPGKVKLLEGGRRMAEQIIRRHRLAERLICDVLGSKVEESEDAACEFEHLLAPGITNSICTLLGHPRFCPHSRAIPEGDCCRQAREELKPIVISCDQLRIGGLGRVAYVSTREHTRLVKLATLGIVPGVSVRLLQKWPSFVVQCEETEVALEPSVARDIYVWQS